MYNEALFERVRSLCGGFFMGEIEERLIDKWEEKLGVTFPNSYREFLRKFGDGCLCGMPYLGGISNEDFSAAWEDTSMYREKGILPQEHIVVATSGDVVKTNGEAYGVHNLYCLDSGHMADGECPVLVYHVWETGKVELEEYASNYWEMFDKMVQELYLEKGVEKEEWLASNGDKRDLPTGMGYKSCFMVIEGVSQKTVLDIFLQGKAKKYTYNDGLAIVGKADIQENTVLVSSVYKKQIYIIGDTVSQFFYDTERFLEKCKELPRVYVYMTHRVSETHGFALVENGELIRFFCYDEEDIRNIGKPLPEEIALEYQLPYDFEDVRNKEEYTMVDEEVIVELAIRQVGIDVKQYTYKDVKVGEMIV